MIEFLREGGTIILLLVALSPVMVGVAASFAYRPTPKKRIVANAFLRWALFASLTGYVAGTVGTLRATEYYFDKPEQQKWWEILIAGTRESLNNLLLGVGLIALCCLFLAVGEARNKAL